MDERLAMTAHASSRWEDLPLRGKALVAISLPLTILMFSLVLIYIAERQTARAEEDVRRVLLVQGDIQTLHTQIAEGAASVRGYLLTHREDFLPGYLNAQPLIEAALTRLNTNVRDGQMREHLKAIEPLINTKVEGLGKLRSMNRQDQETVARILIENKYVLDQLRERIGIMREREDALLAERTEAAAATRERLLLSTLLAAACGIFGAILAVLMLSKGIVARVHQVQRNAQRLALGHPLLPQPPEKDEIGQLGTRLVEAGQLLAERERALRDNEERLRLIIEGVKDYGIFALDRNGYITTWNAGAERIKGYTEQEIIGQHFSVFYLQQECPQHPDMALHEATVNGRYTEEGWRQRKDGSRFWASVVITAQYDSNDELRGFSKITRDISDRRVAEIALGTAREEAERASRAKSEFLSRMSHELRTPLTILRIHAQNARQAETPEQRLEALDFLVHGVDRAARLASQLLTMARLEPRLEVSQLQTFELNTLVREEMAELTPLALEKRVDLVFEEGEDCVIRSDPAAITIALQNLLTNALNFAPTASEIRVVLHTQEDGSAHLSVEDAGPGIDEQQKARLFERFYSQGHSNGAGLGLAIVDMIVRKLESSLHLRNSAQGGLCAELRIKSRTS
ncbi:Sensor histidine kinase QseC [Pseudomonas syringae pv. aptata]|uniref:histidine kinase n=1 Tax=Pseudomonas syringae pv. aptata TaxID=83167 RepID=A0A3M3X1Z2_PSEAP|nr:Sensor histidine kinase QseC [Pseudomonas syringae pv. aptata]